LFIPTALASGNDWANTLRSQGQLLQRSREFFEKLHSKVHALIHTYICKRIQDELVNERNRLLGFAFQIERHPGNCCRKRIALFKVKVNLITWEQNQESSSSTLQKLVQKKHELRGHKKRSPWITSHYSGTRNEKLNRIN
jgi:hypothetical protein